MHKPSRQKVPKRTPVAEVDEVLAEVHALAPTLLDVRLRGSAATDRCPPRLEAVLDRGTSRLRTFLYTPDGLPVDRANEIGRFLGLRSTTASEVQACVLRLADINPLGAWTPLPQQFTPELTWDSERIRTQATYSQRLLDNLADLAEDAPWLHRIDALSREEGSSRGYTRLRRYIRFVSVDLDEVAVLDMAYAGRLIDTITFGEEDRFQRNTQRVHDLAARLSMDLPTLADTLDGLTLPFSFSSRVARLIVNPIAASSPG